MKKWLENLIGWIGVFIIIFGLLYLGYLARH